MPSVLQYGKTGQAVKLNQAALFKISNHTTSYIRKTGTFYIWSPAIQDGKIRICSKKTEAGKKGLSLGWVRKSQATLISPNSHAKIIPQQTLHILTSVEQEQLRNLPLNYLYTKLNFNGERKNKALDDHQEIINLYNNSVKLFKNSKFNPEYLRPVQVNINTAWCAAGACGAFAKFGLVGIGGSYKPLQYINSSTKNLRTWAENKKIYHKANGGYTPKTGDISIQDGHTEIVWYVENGIVYTIGCNLGNTVKCRKFKLSSSKLKGFISLDFSKLLDEDYKRIFKTDIYKKNYWGKRKCPYSYLKTE